MRTVTQRLRLKEKSTARVLNEFYALLHHISAKFGALQDPNDDNGSGGGAGASSVQQRFGELHALIQNELSNDNVETLRYTMIIGLLQAQIAELNSVMAVTLNPVRNASLFNVCCVFSIFRNGSDVESST
jgi:hypothetical protein